jgi:hypothetical protein
VDGIGSVLELGFGFVLDCIEHSYSIVRGRLSLSLQEGKRVAHCVGGVLHFQHKRQRAMDDDLREICRHGLALATTGKDERVLKVGAEASRVLVEWGWPCGRAGATLSP